MLGHHTDTKQYHDDDVEANAATFSGNGYGGPTAKDLSEYEKLDRFITTYDAGGGNTQVEEEQKYVPWWKFWVSDDSGDRNEFDGKPPPAWLETDIHAGIRSSEVTERRRRFGWNELTAEKENQFRKFLSFFQGPILYGKLRDNVWNMWLTFH